MGRAGELRGMPTHNFPYSGPYVSLICAAGCDALSCTGSGVDSTEHHFTGKEPDSERATFRLVVCRRQLSSRHKTERRQHNTTVPPPPGEDHYQYELLLATSRRVAVRQVLIERLGEGHADCFRLVAQRTDMTDERLLHIKHPGSVVLEANSDAGDGRAVMGDGAGTPEAVPLLHGCPLMLHEVIEADCA